MFDFDHPVRSMRHEVKDVLDRYGYAENLFIYTLPYEENYTRSSPRTSRSPVQAGSALPNRR